MGLLHRSISLVSVAIVITNADVVCAQFEEDNSYYIGVFEIEADEEQRARLYDIEVKYSDLLEPLKDRLRELHREIGTLQQKSSTEVHASLVPSQIESINAQRLAETRENVSRDVPFLVKFAKFARGLAYAESIELLEGFSRRRTADGPVSDSDAIKVKGFNFYPEPLRETGGKLEVLRQSATNHQHFSPTRPGGKFCGGFHPDLALRYKVDDVQHHALICLTCYELWVLQEGLEEVVKFDFSSNARSVFKRVAESCFVNHELAVP